MIKPLTIGSTQFTNNLALAPMAGTTDLPFRKICQAHGAGLTVTELVSARGIQHDHTLKRNWRYLAIDPQAGTECIQLFSSEAADFSQAIERILAHPLLSRCRAIDLNMGCPVKKVVATGAGSALMTRPEQAEAIIRASVRVAQQADKPVMVKIRSGWDEGSLNAVDFARRCEDSGAAAITIHARTRKQMYGGKADWALIARVKQAVSIPVFGNGDVIDGPSARRCLEQTRVDGVMIGRAARGNPWVFDQILQLARGVERPEKPTVDMRIQVVLQHWRGLCDLLGEQTALKEMRQHLVSYFRGSPCATQLRARTMRISSADGLLAVLEAWRICCQKEGEQS